VVIPAAQRLVEQPVAEVFRREVGDRVTVLDVGLVDVDRLARRLRGEHFVLLGDVTAAVVKTLVAALGVEIRGFDRVDRLGWPGEPVDAPDTLGGDRTGDGFGGEFGVLDERIHESVGS
jgi:class 3 adenylate cyclase